MKKSRGTITDKAKQIFQEFYTENEKLTDIELKLYPYMDWCLKNGLNLESHKLSNEELALLPDLLMENSIYKPFEDFRVSKEYYDFIQSMLAETYVNFIEEVEE